ncbi:unnamed protein product [Porites lobata]|uniref:G-protein coupled receptors family 1 profile domain-containing protein n=1 Tax=Porites lobata TaxID=104759 RepID=A0ABN8PXZ4_9CNID|nr:unnamed protein product [Porites lobata]
MTITANFTGLEKQTTLNNPVERYCAPELAEGIQHPLVCLIVLNIFLSICAFLGNSIILVALHKKLSLHTPSKLLLRCLSASDLCVGLIAEPAIVVYWTSLVFEGNTTCRYSALISHITGYILGSVSLLTLTAISIDRLLALILGLRYKQIVTLKRTCMTVIAVWLLSMVCYLPYAVEQALPKSPNEKSQSLYLVRAMTLTLVDLNSSLNPILYYWRIGQVRRAVKETLRRLAFLNGTIFFCTVEPPCATTSRKRPSIQNTKTFPVKALQLEPLVNDHLL